MMTALIIFGVIVLILGLFWIYRQYLISKMTHAECLQKLRAQRKLYYLLPDTNTRYAKAVLKSIRYLEKRTANA